jgi:hypothetical protein
MAKNRDSKIKFSALSIRRKIRLKTPLELEKNAIIKETISEDKDAIREAYMLD